MVSHWKGDCHWGLRGTGSGLRCRRGEMSAPFVFSCNATNPPHSNPSVYMHLSSCSKSVFPKQMSGPASSGRWLRSMKTEMKLRNWPMHDVANPTHPHTQPLIKFSPVRYTYSTLHSTARAARGSLWLPASPHSTFGLRRCAELEWIEVEALDVFLNVSFRVLEYICRNNECQV